MQYNDSDELCHCFGVTYGELKEKIKELNLKTLDDVLENTDIGSGCGSCHDDVEMVLNEVNS